tara:strand:- start:268 stop:1116 length:849 start_codon:yes stop_codon:yes gene_type:complete
MKSLLDNINKNNIIFEPFPHLDIKNALPEDLHKKLLAELPKEEDLKKLYDFSKKKPESAIQLDIDFLESHGYKVPLLKEFSKLHSGPDFSRKIFEIFSELIHERFGKFKKELTESFPNSLFVNTSNTTVSDLSKNTFIRGAHLDAASDIGVFLFYLKPSFTEIEGGNLELYKFKSRFRGFRRDIWWDEREISKKHIIKSKEITYESNRFIFLLDGIDSIHGVSEMNLIKGLRYRVSGGISTPTKHLHYDYKEYLTKFEKLKDFIGIYSQKILRKKIKLFNSN